MYKVIGGVPSGALRRILDFSGGSHARVSQQFRCADELNKQLLLSELKDRNHRFPSPALEPVLKEQLASWSLKSPDDRASPVVSKALTEITNWAKKKMSPKEYKKAKAKGPVSIHFFNDLNTGIQKREKESQDHALMILGEWLLVDEDVKNPPLEEIRAGFTNSTNLERIADVNTVRLDGKNLRVIPKELEAFKNIKELDLNNNCIECVAHFPAMPKLTTLFLRDNKLTVAQEDLPAFIQQLKVKYPSLRHLELQNNQIPTGFAVISDVLVTS